MSLRNKSMWLQTKTAVESYVNYAREYCNGVDDNHFRQYIEWYYLNEREIAQNPITFVRYVTRFQYDIDTLKEIKSKQTGKIEVSSWV